MVMFNLALGVANQILKVFLYTPTQCRMNPYYQN